MHRSSIHVAVCFVPFLISLVGCGGNSVSGSIGGNDVDVQSVISGITVLDGKPQSAVVLMSNRPDLCAIVEAGGLQNPPSFQMLFFALAEADFTTNATKPPTGPGDFEVFSGQSASLPKSNNVATVFYMETDASGKSTTADGLVLGTKGTITLDSLGSDNAMAGEGAFTLSTGDELEIEYDATPCAALASFNIGGSDPTNPPPPSGDTAAALQLNVSSPGAGCSLMAHQAKVGAVDGSSITTVIPFNDPMSYITCSVEAGAGANPLFTGHVQGNSPDGYPLPWFDVNIPSLSPSATKANPALGTIAYRAFETKSEFYSSLENACAFYFVEPPAGSVDPNKIWLGFSCTDLSDMMGSVCAVSESYLAFQNCAVK